MKKRKRATIRKHREFVDKAVESLIKAGRLTPERANKATYRIGGAPVTNWKPKPRTPTRV